MLQVELKHLLLLIEEHIVFIHLQVDDYLYQTLRLEIVIYLIQLLVEVEVEVMDDDDDELFVYDD